MKNKTGNKDTNDNNNRYHDTEALLRDYRDIRYSISASIEEMNEDFVIECDMDVKQYLRDVYDAVHPPDAPKTGAKLLSHAKSIIKSYKMIKQIDVAIERLRFHHKNGEELYWVLYYNYLVPQEIASYNNKIERLQGHCPWISAENHYRYKRRAIEALSLGLFGYTAQKHLAITALLLEDDEDEGLYA